MSRLAARVVEVIRNRDDRVGDGADDAFAVLLQFTKNQRRDEFGRDFMSVELTVVTDRTHLALNTLDDVFRIFHRGAASVRTDDNVPVFRKQNQTCRFDVVVFVWNWRRFPLFVDDRQRGKSRA